VGAPILPTLFWIPGLNLIEFLLITGIALVIAGVSVFYEDVKHLMVSLLQVLYFAVPVMYLTEMVRSAIRHHHASMLLFQLYMLNPLVTIITAFRAWMLQPPSAPELGFTTAYHVPLTYLLFTTVASIAIAAGGYSLFNRMKWSFVERP
jgi:ABC-type polysaccharide/polyol phosphate export permease